MQTHRAHTDIPTCGAPSRRRPFAPHAVMWAAIGLALALFGLLLALGWRDNAATTAGAALLLTCVAVCIWAGAQSRIADREVNQAIARLAALREDDDQRRRRPGSGPES